MKKVYKYPLEVTDKVQLIVTNSIISNPLTAIERNGGIVIYIEHDTKFDDVNYNIVNEQRFIVVGTGQEFTLDNAQYISTVKLREYVFHVYKVH